MNIFLALVCDEKKKKKKKKKKRTKKGKKKKERKKRKTDSDYDSARMAVGRAWLQV